MKEDSHWLGLAVAARMVGNTLDIKQKKHLFKCIISLDLLPKGSNVELKKLRKEISSSLLELPDPMMQGMALARWLRKKGDLVDRQGRVEPETILSARWHVDVVNIISSAPQLDAVAVWDNGLKPTIFVNCRGPRASQDAGRRFTLAHEMAHLLVDSDRDGDVQGGRELPDRDMETRANAFAAELILPEDRAHDLLKQHERSMERLLLVDILNQLTENFRFWPVKFSLVGFIELAWTYASGVKICRKVRQPRDQRRPRSSGL